MHILVSNDDGVLAPGIKTLVEHLLPHADKVTVIAPDRNVSGVSSGISLETPLRVTELRPGWWQLNGTPADCTKLALSGFMTEEPDILISGINAGPNLGDDVIYSGTVGAALEGRWLRYPPIAISLASHDTDKHFDTAGQVAAHLLKQLMRNPLSGQDNMVLNVNVPNVATYEDLAGFQVTRQGDRHFSEPLKPTRDGRDKPIYWLGEAGRVKDGSIGTDFHAVSHGYVSITPIHVDMTVHHRMNEVENWLN